MILLAAVAPATARKVNGVPGFASERPPTTGKQIPPPARNSRRDQAKRLGFQALVAAARCATQWARPNVLLIMTDDQGYGVSGTFGGIIPTPAMDRIAKAGYATHSSTPLLYARRRGRR